MLKRNVLLGGTAGVIVEPVGPESGTRPVAHDYNAGVRTLCDKYGALMIFDEPEAGIDLWSFQNLISVFERMRQVRSDRTILVISHQERILNIADEIIVLAEGKIVSHGSRAEILPTLLGTPSAVSACAQLEKTTGKEGNC